MNRQVAWKAGVGCDDSLHRLLHYYLPQNLYQNLKTHAKDFNFCFL